MKNKLENILIVTMFLFLVLIFTEGCKSRDAAKKVTKALKPDPKPKTEAPADGTKLYEEKSAFTIPFTNTRFGCFKLSTVSGKVVPKPSRLIARKWIIWFLLAVAGVSFLFIPAGLFAALYYKWGGGWILAGLGGLVFFVSAGSAYFFDWIMWVWLAGFIIAIIAGLYWIYREHRNKHVTNQLVETVDLLKEPVKAAGQWTDTLRNQLNSLQSKTTRKTVLGLKILSENQNKKAEISVRKKKAE